MSTCAHAQSCHCTPQASLLEFVQTAAKFRIRLVPEYALLARSCSIIDGILRSRLPG